MSRFVILLFPLVLAFAISRSVLAADSYTIPLSVVPGSVTVEPGIPVGMPFSVPVAEPRCNGTGTFSAEVVNGGLEVEFTGAVFPDPDPEVGSCSYAARASMQVEVRVPELGGTATMVRLEGVPLAGNFSSLYQAAAGFNAGHSGTSSSVPGLFKTEGLASIVGWSSAGANTLGAYVTELQAWVPGDTLRFPVSVSSIPSASVSVPTQGTFRVRWVIKATVPEPSATLSIPIGALGLAGLASLRTGAGS